MINSLYSARKSASEKTPTARGTPVTGTFRTTLLLNVFFFVGFVFQMQAAAKKKNQSSKIISRTSALVFIFSM